MASKTIEWVVENIEKTGHLLNEYNHLKNLNSKENHTLVYPDHSRQFAPVFKLDVDKEIEILANKFRIMSTPGVVTMRVPDATSNVQGTRTWEEVKGQEFWSPRSETSRVSEKV